MDYLIGIEWPWWVLGLIAVVMIGDEIWFRYERRNVALANRYHITKHEPPEFIDEDDLCVISNDTDEVVFTGRPPAVWDWLKIYQGTSSLDVYNQDTGKLVTSAYFKSKYVE
jgi:hypothetical protein